MYILGRALISGSYNIEYLVTNERIDLNEA